MASAIPIILTELYYHRVFMRTNREPSVLDIEPIARICDVVTLVSDVLDYALFFRDIEGFVSPFDKGFLKKDSTVVKYFSFDIGDATAHRCAIEESFGIAKEKAFDERKLLNLPPEEAMKYVEEIMGLVILNTRPVNISFIYALAFSCSLCGIVARNGKQELMSSIAVSTAFVFLTYYPLQWMYYDFKQWAFSYVFRHKQIHGGGIHL